MNVSVALKPWLRWALYLLPLAAVLVCALWLPWLCVPLSLLSPLAASTAAGKQPSASASHGATTASGQSKSGESSESGTHSQGSHSAHTSTAARGSR